MKDAACCVKSPETKASVFLAKIYTSSYKPQIIPKMTLGNSKSPFYTEIFINVELNRIYLQLKL